jgi:glycosyltransferase involved in cell wall biosynthesis
MRIVYDAQVLQSSSRWRGLGRYTINLLREFFKLRPDHQHVLLGSQFLSPFRPEDLHTLPAQVVYLPYGPNDYLNRELLAEFLDEAGTDLYVECSPFENAKVPNVAGLTRAKLGVIHYDIIPALFPEKYLPDTAHRASYAERMRLLTSCDFVLSISDCSKQDLIRHLGLHPRLVGDIGGGVDSFFYAEDSQSPPAEISSKINDLAHSNCIFYLGGEDWRKNEATLLKAYALLPETLRAKHPLVFTHTTATAESRERHFNMARELGVEDRLFHTGFVEDHDLRHLYQHCHLFVFPSLYEGYGLPIAEAMVCGAAVAASDVSSMPEVCGNAAEMISDPADPQGMADTIRKVLEDDGLRQDLKRRALARREHFRWSTVARRMDFHLNRWMDGAAAPALRTLGTPARRRIAIFSPVPPLASGISDYTADLLPYLQAHYDIDLFVDDGFEPDYGDPRLKGSRIFRHHEFEQLSDKENYFVVNHQLGNSKFHFYQLKWLLRHPSVVMLHDPSFAEFMFTYKWRYKRTPLDLDPECILAKECGAAEASALLPQLYSGQLKVEDLYVRNIFMNDFVFRYADAVMMQTHTACETFRRRPHPLEDASIHYAPQPIPPPSQGGNAAEFRAKNNIPADSLLIATFGIVHQVKQPEPLLHAFIELLAEYPSAHLVFVGSHDYVPQLVARVHDQGLAHAVHFCGRVSMEEFYDGMAAADVVASLRYPCHEQLSGSLLRSMSCGRAIIASEVPSHDQLPADALWRVPSIPSPVAELKAALLALAASPELRQKLGDAAREHIQKHHDPAITAAAYREAFEGVQPHVMILERHRLLRSALRLGAAYTEEAAIALADARSAALAVREERSIH